MRFLAWLGLALAALLSLSSTFAVQNARVTGGAVVPVTATDQALIALAPNQTASNDGNRAGTAYYENALTKTTLLLDFTKGLNGTAAYGFTPRNPSYASPSVFEYRRIFSVTNNSQVPQCVSVYVPGTSGPPELRLIQVDGIEVAGTKGVYANCRYLAAGATGWVTFRWEITRTAGLANTAFSVVVDAHP
jgi:hypothetical protein